MAALIDAGIPLRSTILAVSGTMKTDKISVNSEELDDESRPFMFMFDVHKEVSTPFCFEMYQPLSKEKMNEVAAVAKASSREVFDSLKSAVQQRLGLRQ
jgi:ribonuclease PH